jgi:hypothetical protein
MIVPSLGRQSDISLGARRHRQRPSRGRGGEGGGRAGRMRAWQHRRPELSYVRLADRPSILIGHAVAGNGGVTGPGCDGSWVGGGGSDQILDSSVVLHPPQKLCGRFRGLYRELGTESVMGAAWMDLTVPISPSPHRGP